MGLYSRRIVGWEAHIADFALLGVDVGEKVRLSERLHGKPLVLHSDHGSPIRAIAPLAKRYELGIAVSNSRPRVSDDNAAFESLFIILKYTPLYPTSGFKGIDVCRQCA